MQENESMNFIETGIRLFRRQTDSVLEWMRFFCPVLQP